MDAATLQKLLVMLASDNDTDAIMGLRGLQGHFREEGVDFSAALSMTIGNIDALKKAPKDFTATVVEPKPSDKAAAAATAPVALSGMPQCRARGNQIEIIVPGKSTGDLVALPGAAAAEAAPIAEALKDALVAAAINKSRMKLKLLDVKGPAGEVVETILQAEYEREGMTPIQVWVNVRGEVASLAAVLRKAIAHAVPELVAA